MLKNTDKVYGAISRLLHWGMAIAVLGMIVVGFIMANMPNSEQKFQLINLHKATGVLILLFVLLRLIWKLINITVNIDIPTWHRLAAKIGHTLLYILMFVMPISGIVMSIVGGRNINIYGIYIIEAVTKNEQIATAAWIIHSYMAWAFASIISLHILAALYHHFIRKDNVLKSMIGSIGS